MPRTTRAALLAGFAAAATLAACGKADSHAIRVGSKNFTEEYFLGELYSQVLEGAGFRVERRLNLGGTEIAMAALQKGELDLYPEYTGTALLTVLKLPIEKDATTLYDTVKREYASRYDLTWLKPSPFNDTQALATTTAVSAKYRIKTLSDLAAAAPQLRLGAVPEFVQRADALPGLQKAYGGFRFKSTQLLDSGIKYKALLQGDVDVVVAFSTEGALASNALYVFVDDKHFWPTYNVAPVVRTQTLTAYGGIATHLDAVAPLLTDPVIRGINAQIDGPTKADPEDVARAFIKAHGLLG